DAPFDRLALEEWKVVDVTETEVDGRRRKSVAFATDVIVHQLEGEKVKVLTDVKVGLRKTFTLTEGEYHLGVEVEIKSDTNTKFRYQLAGARGLPIEGRWYTSTFRNALIGSVEKGSVYRDFQDLRQIGLGAGGKPVERQKDKDRFLRYAAVAV